jgi:hypothetical protein
LTASVKDRKRGGPTPIGSITFFNGTASLGTVALRRGKASLKTSSLNLGPNTIQADFTSSQGFAPSSKSIVEIVRAQRSTSKAARFAETARSAVPLMSMAIRVGEVALIPARTVTIASEPTALGPIAPDQGTAAGSDVFRDASRHFRTAPAETDSSKRALVQGSPQRRSLVLHGSVDRLHSIIERKFGVAAIFTAKFGER